MADFTSDRAAASLRGRLLGRPLLRSGGLALASMVLLAATCSGDDSASTSTTTVGPNGKTLPRAEQALAGEVLVDGDAYPFEPTTCSAAPDRFVVAGSGTTSDGEPFFVTVQAPDSISLVVGAESETDDPDPDLPWYRSLEPATLRGDGTEVKGQGFVVNSHGSAAREFTTSVSVTCEPDDG